MSNSLIPTSVEIIFTEQAGDRGSYVITVHRLNRTPEGRRAQSDHFAFRTPSRKGPNWNGERLAAFVEMLISQFPADAALMDELTFENQNEG